MTNNLSKTTLTAVALLLAQTSCANTSSEAPNLQDIYMQALEFKDENVCDFLGENHFECLGSVHYQLSLIKKIDLDGDGIQDILAKSVESMDGANYGATELRMIMLDDKNQLKDHHSLLLDSNGAYQTLDIKSVEATPNGAHISAIASLKDKNLDGVMDNRDAPLDFIWQSGVLYEQSYLNQCQLAKMTDKRIFDADPYKDEVSRMTGLDGLDYTQHQQEKDMIEGIFYQAKLHGCDNLKITFSASHTGLTPSTVLSNLAKFTRFKSVFNDSSVQAYIKQANPSANEWLYTNTGWKVNVQHSKVSYGEDDDEVENSILVQLTQVNNTEEQGSHWNRVLRLKP